jgi:hypothetical protein
MIRENPIGIKINLPVVIRMTIWTHRQHRTRQIEFEDLNVRRAVRLHIMPAASSRFEQPGCDPHCD